MTGAFIPVHACFYKLSVPILLQIQIADVTQPGSFRLRDALTLAGQCLLGLATVIGPEHPAISIRLCWIVRLGVVTTQHLSHFFAVPESGCEPVPLSHPEPKGRREGSKARKNEERENILIQHTPKVCQHVTCTTPERLSSIAPHIMWRSAM